MAHYPPQRIRAANAARTHASDFSVTTAPATLADAQAAVEAYGHQRSYMVHTLTFLLLTTLFVLAFGGRVAAKSLPRPTMLAPTCYTTATVLNSADSGAGSLRDAVNNVCAGGGTIEFAPGLSGQTIVLTSGELVPTADLTIDGATLTDPVTISGNDLSRIFNIDSVTVTLNSLTLTHGNAVNENGGAIHIAGTAVVTITHSTIANSHATYAGGAVRLAPGTLTVLDTLFFSNTAGSLGGAISNNTGTVTIRNSTFTQNGAAGSGVITNLSDSTMTIDASTFNGATLFGKGINNRGTLHLRNTIIANMPNIGCDTDIGTVATNLNNLIEDGSCSATFRGDAHLGPLQDNGGPTLTHALLYNSPAIDQGESATCLATDQRGVSRPQAAGCDIGAYELVQPEIALLGDDLPISAGATSAAATNHTDFGTVIVGQSITHTFVISNSGPGDLALTNLPAVVITPATGFTLAATPALTVATTSTTSFQIAFAPVAAGDFTATVQISNTDVTESHYTFVVHGIAKAAPAAVRGQRYATLQAAIDAANTGDTVRVIAGTLSDLETVAGLTQVGYITKALTIEGGCDSNFTTCTPNTPTTLDADYRGRVLVISGTVGVTLTNLIVTHGNAYRSVSVPPTLPFSAPTAPAGRLPYGSRRLPTHFSAGLDESTADYGGGILIQGSEVRLVNTTVAENSAVYGGGLFVGSTLYCDATCTITNNYAVNGGGLFVSTATTTSTLVLNGGQIISNTAEDAGGGVFVEGPTGYLTMTAGTIANNLSHAFAGGVMIVESHVDLVGGTLEGNVASGEHPIFGPEGYGGGLYQYGGALLLAGTTVNANRADFYGGGLHIESGTTIITDTLITSNQTITDDGGGLYIGGGLLTIDNSQVVSNSAGNDGGGLFAEEYFDQLQPITITNSLVQNNAALDSGGGLYFFADAAGYISATQILSNTTVDDGAGLKVDAGELMLVDSTVQGNRTADSGGGLYVENSLATIDHSTIRDNHALDDAGGVKVFADAVMTMTHSLVQENSAYSYGGGIVNDGSQVAINNTTISANTVISATDPNAGGGLDSYGGELRLTYTTIADNETTNGGGGLALGGGDILTMTNVTISGNRAASGGGLYLIDAGTTALLNNVSVISNTATITGGGVTITGADLSLANTLIGNNVGALGADCYGALLSQGNNLVEEPTGCTGLIAGDLTNHDPRVGPRQDNGGDTATHALLLGSPALDTANSATCAATDQRTVTRPQGAACDMGAFELIQPEIAILGNSRVIADGDSTPDRIDHTDFDEVRVGTAITHTFTISNSGQTDLQLTDPALVQIRASTPFTLVTPPAATIAPTSTTTFQLRFQPTAQGLFTATVTLASNDVDETNYAFLIQGLAYRDPTVTKLVSGDPVAAGEALTYTLVISNGSPLTVTNGVISDTLPAAANLVAGSVTLDPPQPSATRATTGDKLPTLVSGLTISATSQVTVTYAVTTATNFSGTLVNTAHLSATSPVIESRATVAGAVWRNALAISDAAVTEGDSGTALLTFIVSRTHNLTAVTVDYATVDNTATAGSDYLATSGTLTFNVGGPLVQTITVTAFGDTAVEATERLTVTLADAVGALLDDADGVGAITNDDSATVALTGPAAQLEGDSGTTSYLFTATLDSAVPGGLTLSYTTNDGTATTGDNDYLDNDGTLIFAGTANETQLITVSVVGDGQVERDETFDVALGAVTTSSVATDTIVVDTTAQSATIRNDDRAQLTIADATVDEGESGPTTILLTVTLDSAVDLPLTVDFATADGSATAADNDYLATSGTITFTGAVSETQSITLTVNGDTFIERTEDFTVNLSNLLAVGGNRAITLADTSATVTITNDDAATLAFVLPSSLANEDRSSHAVAVILASTEAVTLTAPITVVVVDQFKGNALAAGVDYAVSNPTVITFAAGSAVGTMIPVRLTINNDRLIEGNETLALAIQSANDPLGIVQLDRRRATHSVTIIDNDVAYGLQAEQSSVLEGDSGSTTISFTVTRTGAITTTSSTVDLTLGGAATMGVDYDNVIPASQQVSFGTGITMTRVTLDVLGDRVIEHHEPITMALTAPAVDSTSGTALVVGTSQQTTIIDDDVAGIVVTGDSSRALAEGDPARPFTVTLQSIPTATVTIALFVDDQLDLGAGAGSPLTLTFAADNSALTPQRFTVTAVDDPVVEAASLTSTVTFAVSSVATAYDGYGVTGLPLTVLDNDNAHLTMADATVDEGDSGTTTVALTVTLDNAVDLPFTVDYATSDGSATLANLDYVIATGTLTFTGSAGETQLIRVPIIGDTQFEANEGLSVTLRNLTFGAGSRAVTLGRSTATATIVNDDHATVTLSGGGVQDEGDSGTTSYSFTATLDSAVVGGFAIDYATNDGTATVGDGDYLAANGTLLFAGLAGERHPFTVTVTGDTLVERDESFAVTLGTISGTLTATVVTAGSPQSATIRNDDRATIALVGATVMEGNSGTTAAILTATLDAAVDSNITVTYNSRDDSATVANNDYERVTGMLTFTGALGESHRITVPVLGDTMVEDDEVVAVALSDLSAGGRAVTLDPMTATVLIRNDDPVAVRVDDVALDEGDSGTRPFTFTLTLDHHATEDITVAVSTIADTAQSGLDFTPLTSQVVTISAGLTATEVIVAVNGETTVEANERFTVTLSNVRIGGVSDPTRAIIGDGNGLGLINNDDSTTYLFGALVVDEGNSGPQEHTYPITITNGVEGGFTMHYSTRDLTATVADNDYRAISGTLNFVGTAGEVQTITLTINGDTIVEPIENIALTTGKLTNTALTDYIHVPRTPPLIAIRNDDSTAITIADASGDEGAGVMIFQLALTNPSAAPVTVDYQTVDDSARAGADYTMSSGTVTFTAGALTATVAIPLREDTLDELPESFAVALHAPNPAATTTISDSSALGQIIDNDEPPTLRVDAAHAVENGGPLTFIATLSTPSARDVGVDYQSMDGSAVAGQDYVATSGHITLTAGALTTTVPVTLLNDDRHELTEQFQLVLNSPTQATLAINSATGTIDDDDPVPVLHVADSALHEGENGTQSLIFTVTLSNSLAAGFSVDYQTQDGSALAGEDYVATNGLLNFAGNDGEQHTIAVPINGDTTIESDEQFTITLRNLQAGAYTVTLAPTGGVGTIVNDDFAPNLPPLANNDGITTTENSAVVIAPLANDSDPENGALTLVAVGSPSGGNVVQNGTLLTYTPPVDLAGSATFTYTIADERDQRATAQVTVQIIDQLPTAANLILTVTNDADGDGHFSQQENAPLASAQQQLRTTATDIFSPLVIPVQVTLSNAGNEALIIQSFNATADALATSPCAAWPGTAIAPAVTQQCVYTLTIPGDDNLTITETVALVVADNENNAVAKERTTVMTTPDLAPAIQLTADPNAGSHGGEITVKAGTPISCTVQINNLTPEQITLQTLAFRLNHTARIDGSITSSPLTPPASCHGPAALAGLSETRCLVTTMTPPGAHSGDSLQCVVTVAAADDDGGAATVGAATDRYTVVEAPTNLPDTPEPATPLTKIFLPWVAAHAP